MKTIRIFLASSKELTNDRNAIGNLVRRLDKIYEKRGIRIELFEWEDTDAAYNNRRKQDEYNDEVRASDIFLALFHKKGGKFTIEEFDVASEEYRRTGITPKPYVYCRELLDGEEESAELKEFKLRLFNEMGYYWCNYNNEDSLQLHFVMQLQLVENKRLDELNMEDGEVTLNGTTVARMDNLRFAAENPDYQRMRQRLMELPELIEKARQRKDKYPDDEDLCDEHQKLINERNNLQEVFKQQQELLFDTAKRIAQLHGEQITDRMRRAIEAFDRGDVHEANIILDEAKRDAAQNLTNYRQSKALTEQRRQNVIHSIEELLFNTSTIMADASITIEERITETKSLYAQADEMAAEVDYDMEKYSVLLYNYAYFLLKYGLYHDSEAVWLRQIRFAEELYGTKHNNTAISYNNIGTVYWKLGEYSKALKYHIKALEINETVHGKEHPDIAKSYINIGLIYWEQGNYPKALEYQVKALEINENVLGINHPNTAANYVNVGVVYKEQGNYPQALECYLKALKIYENVFGPNYPDTAITYVNIGAIYKEQGNSSMSLEYYKKALQIQEMILGTDHPDTALTYNNIGTVYVDLEKFSEALDFLLKAKDIKEKVLGMDHHDTACSYNNIGAAYTKLEKYPEALEYFFKALKIVEGKPWGSHTNIACSYTNIGEVYHKQGKYVKALECCCKAAKIYEEVLGMDNLVTANSYNNIGWLYYEKKDYKKALEYLKRALNIQKKKLGLKHQNTQATQKLVKMIKATKKGWSVICCE